MKLCELCRAADVYCSDDKGELEITQVTCDSRRVVRGGLYVCLSGKHDDGEKYCGEAIKNGAAEILHTSVECGELYSDDTRLAYARLCMKMYGAGCEKLKLIAVTGTNGKTTVTELLRNIFTEAGYKCGTVGTLGIRTPSVRLDNRNMTTPDPEELYRALSEMAAQGCEYVFIEASSHALALKKLDALEFELGIFTNLTRDHLDFHLTEKNYFEAKQRLAGLSKRIITNIDTKHGKEFCINALTCSQNTDADFRATNVKYGIDGVSYTLNSSIDIRCRIPGRFTAMNSLEAAAAALTLGIKPSDIQNALSNTTSVFGRLERVDLPCGADVSVFIDYAHTPDALENLLLSVRDFADGRRIVLVFGCGGDRDRGKRKLMGAVATKYADFTVVTSDNSRSEEPRDIIEEILKGIDKEKRYTVIENRLDAIRYVINESCSGDIIILAGKGHEKYEIDKNGKHVFDEALAVRKAWTEYEGNSQKQKNKS